MKQSALVLAACCAAAPVAGTAQPRPAAVQPVSAAAAAPVDLTGYWVSPIMEDWRWRMVTPRKGDAASIPLKAETRAVVDAWDPDRDEAAGEACKAYGAPGLLRLPGRLRITWQDENTLRIDTDAGTQSRLLRFGVPPTPETAVSRQGFSMAAWDFGTRGGLGLGLAPGPPARSLTLEVTTTNLLPGYLRKNGIPYSGETTVVEYFDRFGEPDGTEWFTVTTVVTDPVYLGAPFVTTTDFKKEPDGSMFDPTPCSAH